jgi:hypothetical protein
LCWVSRTQTPRSNRCSSPETAKTAAFQELAEQIGREGAVEFERWVRRHFFRQDIISALSYWRLLLATACLPCYYRGDYRDYRVPPPKALEALLPEIFPLVVSGQREWQIRQEIDRVAPRIPDEELEDKRFSRCFECTLLDSTISQALTIQALQKIAQNLSPAERQEVMDWVVRQAPVHRPRLDFQILRADEYLRVEPPGFDMPSILDDMRDYSRMALN